MNIKIAILILLAFSGFWLLVPGPKNACAQAGPTPAGAEGTIAQQTCDTQVWKTMADRARLETEREIMQNQNLIFKADSVLSYTCFDKFTAHAANTIGPLFTHNETYFGSLIVPWGSPNGMDYALNQTVMASMRDYLTKNFGHSYLGGRGQFVGLTDRPDIQDMGDRGSTYTCDMMAQVWKIAKCMNYLHAEEFNITDGFYPFVTLKGIRGGDDVAGYSDYEDVRDYPTEAEYKCDGEPIAGSTWLDTFRASKNQSNDASNDLYYAYGQPLRETFAAVRLLVDDDTAVDCGPSIPTGIEVILGPGTAEQRYKDGVCTNPGCSFTRDGKCTRAGPQN